MIEKDDKKTGLITFIVIVIIMLVGGIYDTAKNTNHIEALNTSVKQLECNITQIKKDLTQIEYVFGIKDGFQPEPWMFQPATEPCIPGEDMGCEE